MFSEKIAIDNGIGIQQLTPSEPSEPCAQIFQLEGEVCSGLGEGSLFTQLDWVRSVLHAQLGFEPWPGTLNLQIQTADWYRARKALMHSGGIGITPAAGFCGAVCFPVKLSSDIRGAVIFPALIQYPLNRFEILAPASIRQQLKLLDGDWLSLKVKTASNYDF